MDTRTAAANRPPRARLSIKPSAYRGEDGFLVSGPDGHGRHVSVFTYTQASAEVIRGKLARDEEIDISDYYIEDEPDRSIPNPPVAGDPCPRAGCHGHLRFSVWPAAGLQLNGQPSGPGVWSIACRTDHDHDRHALVTGADSLSAARRAYARKRDAEGGWPADPTATPYWIQELLGHGLMVGFAPHPTDGQVQCLVTGPNLTIDSGWKATMADALHAAYLAFTAPRCECGANWPPATNYAAGCPEWCSNAGGCCRCYVSDGLAWKRSPERDTVPDYHDHHGFAELDLETGSINVRVYQHDGPPKHTTLTFRGGRLTSPETFWTEGRRRTRIETEADEDTRAKALMLAQRVIRAARPELLARIPAPEGRA